MNATERARRSDSLYYDTQVTNRRALCDMIANLESDLAESKSENTKLRELCRRYGEYVSQDRCEGCVYKMRCNNGLIDECWQLGKIRDLASELGMEMDI